MLLFVVVFIKDLDSMILRISNLSIISKIQISENAHAIIQINEKEIAVDCGKEVDIKIFNFVDDVSEKCTKVLKGYSSFEKGFLLSEDFSIFLGHNKQVESMILFQPGIICTASRDCTIRFWNV